MIIFRYLTKEILNTVLATTAVLLLIFLSTQFVHYLSDAAFGRFSVSVLFHIMILQVPYLLGLLIPLGFYLAILTAYGRLYTDREMMILSSCGVSQTQILTMTMILALVVTFVVLLLSCVLAPYVTRAQQQLMAQAKSAPLVETVMPGRFYSLSDRQVFYIHDVSRDHEQMQGIFVAQQEADSPQHWSIIFAKNGYQTEAQGHVLMVHDGYRYIGTPGKTDFEQQHFNKLTWYITQQQAQVDTRPAVLSTAVLWKIASKSPMAAAELQWRIAFPLSVILLTLLAVPMSKVNPRHGKFAQILPAVLIYIIYANMMFVARSWLQTGVLPIGIGLWWLHALLLLTALGVMFGRSSFANILLKKLTS